MNQDHQVCDFIKKGNLDTVKERTNNNGLRFPFSLRFNNGKLVR